MKESIFICLIFVLGISATGQSIYVQFGCSYEKDYWGGDIYELNLLDSNTVVESGFYLFVLSFTDTKRQPKYWEIKSVGAPYFVYFKIDKEDIDRGYVSDITPLSCGLYKIELLSDKKDLVENIIYESPIIEVR